VPSPATAAAGATLKNVSVRAPVPARGSVAAGFMIGGATEQRLLVRAIGPALSVFGVPNPLADPVLEIHGGDTLRASTTGGWQGAPAIVEAMARVGAFAVPVESQDAALLVTLPPGSYSAVARSASGGNAGEVLIEVYLVG
jgi:hypothetical protein